MVVEVVVGVVVAIDVVAFLSMLLVVVFVGVAARDVTAVVGLLAMALTVLVCRVLVVAVVLWLVVVFGWRWCVGVHHGVAVTGRVGPLGCICCCGWSWFGSCWCCCL